MLSNQWRRNWYEASLKRNQAVMWHDGKISEEIWKWGRSRRESEKSSLNINDRAAEAKYAIMKIWPWND